MRLMAGYGFHLPQSIGSAPPDVLAIPKAEERRQKKEKEFQDTQGLLPQGTR
jgi:hypothetical protein